MNDYLSDPQEIYRRSFALVRDACDLAGLPPGIAALALRMVHASAMPAIVGDLRWDGDVAGAARAALDGGAPVLTDCEMLARGVIRARLPAANAVLCTLNDPAVAGAARRGATTRSAAAVDLWAPHLDGAVVAIGNAPTALYHLLELVRAGGPKPAALLAFPVGFVGAVESKQALIEGDYGIPYITLGGRLGGSAIAAAAVNALITETPA